MFKNKKKSKENFEVAGWIGGALMAVGTALVAISASGIKMLEGMMKELDKK